MRRYQDGLPFDDDSDTTLESDQGIYAIPVYSFRTDEGTAVEAVTVDGETVLWMLSRDHGTDPDAYAPWSPPAHEKVGKLPRNVKLALGYQCRTIRSNGKRCRMLTAELDGLCSQHEDRQ